MANISSPAWGMDTDLKRKLSIHHRLFLVLFACSWLLVGCFIVFQYHREKQFKAERLDARLQLFNMHLLDALGNGTSPEHFATTPNTHPDGVRITIIAPDGTVRYDSAQSVDSLPRMSNHLSRPEIATAQLHGTGYAIRHSESTGTPYFYSAMRGDSLIVRSALPNTLPLHEVLAADRNFLWFMLGITLLLSIAAYLVTRRLGHNIVRLRDFAERAERGEVVAAEPSFPHDELGEISTHIVRLYARLQKTTADRDREHALARHEEQEKIRIKRQLTGNLNHELKTPVTAIQGYLETLLANPQMDAAQRTAFLQKSSDHVGRLRQLLADILTVTRMEEGSEQIRTEPVGINELLDEIRAEVQLLPAERRMRVHCDLPSQVVVEGNAALIGSIFRNLTENATAYSSGRDIFITLAAEDNESYTFLFADNGIGIDEEHLPRIFERFYRIDKGRSRKMGGTGLGLSIVRNAVLFHGGAIEARNREQGGLEFRFSLRKKLQHAK